MEGMHLGKYASQSPGASEKYHLKIFFNEV